MNDLPFKTLPVPNEWDRRGLPAWTYHSPELFEMEKHHVFLNHWQLAGHICDIPAPGDWLSFDILGERGLVMRGQDGVVRAFHNLCRHRGARVVDGAPLGSAPELQEAALSGGAQAGAEGASICPHCAQGSRVHIDEPASVL